MTINRKSKIEESENIIRKKTSKRIQCRDLQIHNSQIIRFNYLSFQWIDLSHYRSNIVHMTFSIDIQIRRLNDSQIYMELFRWDAHFFRICTIKTHFFSNLDWWSYMIWWSFSFFCCIWQKRLEKGYRCTSSRSLRETTITNWSRLW